MNFTGWQRMRPERRSQRLLGITRSKAKMYEYDVPEQHHIDIRRDPANLFPLAIGLLGDLTVRINSEDIDEGDYSELRQDLQFSAQFFDNYLHSRLREGFDSYLLLLGAASYYLRDLPGSSLVLARHLGQDCPDLGCLGLEDLLLWLLQNDFSTLLDGSDGPYREHITGISQWMAHYFENGSGQNEFVEYASNLRRIAYDIGTPRQLLFADVICAIVKQRLENSTWYCLPRYSGLSVDGWRSVLQKETFIRELWPGQHLLGRHGIFRGRSAVVQMPTSAGKTKATEIIIRSAFLAGRTSLAIIVAPFRALCHEIRNDLVEAFRDEPVNINELSNVLQVDFEVMEQLEEQQVVIVTPEKLVYALRHTPELAEHIGLLIYDEGHQFDSGTRGITYELLLTSLKMLVPKEVQTILISAVIRNATAVGNWLNGKDSEVVAGSNLIPTYRTLAFASWLDLLGRLEFVTQENPDNPEFFVPRIIERQQLQLRGKERKQKMFPERTNGRDVALYLGLKIVPKGSVAVFCGRKATASSLCRRAVEVYDRGLSFKKPIEHSNPDEVERLHFLHQCNLGARATATQSAALGIFAHHGNTPQGIRLAVEHAMKKGLATFVICTSTLAQGVNLPIRYLIVTSVYQGRDRIKVRDFHNLIGRAGRAGMYTEGSILFADPVVYDERETTRKGGRRWHQVKELLEPSNSEPCTSKLASIFDPLYSDNRRNPVSLEPLDFVQAYIDNEVDEFIQRVASEYAALDLTTEGLELQVTSKMNIISAVESYLMTYWDDSGNEQNDVTELAIATLAYFLAEDEQRDQIVELFRLLAQNIARQVPDMTRRKIFGKTLYGVQSSIAIEEWVRQHLEDLQLCDSYNELLAALWPLISENVQNNTFKKCAPKKLLQDLALRWIRGESFSDLFQILDSGRARIGTGSRPRYPTVEHVVDICENALSYDATLLVGAISEIVEIVQSEGNSNLIRNLQVLQKQLKYGLQSSSAIILYEMGFADRVVSMELSAIIDVEVSDRKVMVLLIRSNEQELRSALEKYPQYFTQVMDEVL
jgi:superfamily II DNA helicase RecQ